MFAHLHIEDCHLRSNCGVDRFVDPCIEKLQTAAGTYFNWSAMLLSIYLCLYCIVGEFSSNVLMACLGTVFLCFSFCC